jgi:hypothetical protein
MKVGDRFRVGSKGEIKATINQWANSKAEALDLKWSNTIKQRSQY